MYICVCIPIYMYVYVYIVFSNLHICMYKRTFWMYVCAHIHIYMYIYVNICIYKWSQGLLGIQTDRYVP